MAERFWYGVIGGLVSVSLLTPFLLISGVILYFLYPTVGVPLLWLSGIAFALVIVTLIIIIPIFLWMGKGRK